MTKRKYEWTKVGAGIIASPEQFAADAAAAGCTPDEYAARIERAWGGHMRVVTLPDATGDDGLWIDATVKVNDAGTVELYPKPRQTKD